MAAAVGTIPSLSTYQPGALAIGTTVYVEIVDSNSSTTAQSWNMTQQDFVGKAPSVMNYAVPLANDMFAYFQKATGLPVMANVGDVGGTFGNLPAAGATGTLLQKAAATNYAASWVTIASIVTVNQGLVTSGNATAMVVGIGTAQVLSSMIATNAIGTAQLATNIGVTGSFGVGAGLTVTGTISAVGTSTFTGSFNVNGTSSFTSGAFGVVGTSLLTGLVGILGTTAFTGVHGVVGTSLFTSGAFGVVGTATFTSTFGIVGTSLQTGVMNVVGTASITGALLLGTLGAGVLNASSTGVVSSQGGMVLLNTLSPNNVASTNDTTSFTSTYKTYMMTFESVSPATQTTTFQMTVSTSASAFISGGYVSLASVVLGGVGLIADTSTSVLLLSSLRATTQVQTTLSYGVSGFIKLFNPASTVSRKQLVGTLSYLSPGASGTATIVSAAVNGYYDGAVNPITGVNFAFSSGNIQTGTIKIYGLT